MRPMIKTALFTTVCLLGGASLVSAETATVDLNTTTETVVGTTTEGDPVVKQVTDVDGSSLVRIAEDF